MASKYGCEICGDEDFFAGQDTRFAGARQARACNQCVNDWNRKTSGADDAFTLAFREFARANTSITININPHDTDALAKEQGITDTLEASSFATTKALGELWDQWAQGRYSGVAK